MAPHAMRKTSQPRRGKATTMTGVTIARASIVGWLSLVDRIPPVDMLERVLAETAYAYEIRGQRALQARENVKKMRAMIRRVQNRGYVTLGRIA